MQLMIALLGGFLLMIIGLMVIVINVRRTQLTGISRRLHDYVVEAPIEQPRLVLDKVRQDELSGSFIARTLVPGFKALAGIFGRLTPANTQGLISRQLTIAGNPLRLGAREFFGLRLIFIILGVWLGILVFQRFSGPIRFIFSPLAYFYVSSLPKIWLSSRVRKRQNQIRKGLPDALDMLSVCAEAGLGFDQSLLRVSEQWKTPLGAEFGRVVAEMEMGVSRRDSLRHLAERTDVAELSSFVAVILQSDELGMSIAETLHSQAAQMRIERRFRAQEAARKIPVKMLFPMIFLILPSLMAVILGPLVPVFGNFFAGLSGNLR